MALEPDRWSELRAFEHCPPNALAFRALVGLLDTWAGDDRDDAIEYAERLLADWPDDTRRAPWSWCKAASRGAVEPTWVLVRALELESGHLTKGTVDLARLARRTDLTRISELQVPGYSDYQELSLLYHRPGEFAGLKSLCAADRRGDGDIAALADSPLWRCLQVFDNRELEDSLLHKGDASRMVPQIQPGDPIRHLTLRAPDLIEVWERSRTPSLRSASVIIRSTEEARTLAGRDELARLTSVTLAFRCGFNGNSPFEPFLGNVIEPDEAAAEAFFADARLDALEELAIIGYRMGYWGREGLGCLGLDSLVASGLLQRLTGLRLSLLPLGDDGVTAVARSLGEGLESLSLRDVYCKGAGAAALSESAGLASLRNLDLAGNRIDSDGARRLAAADLPHLEALDMSGPSINPYYWSIGQQPLLDAGAIAWVERPRPALRELRLANTFLTDETLTALFNAPGLDDLRTLELSHNSFTLKEVEALPGSPRWDRLEHLGLSDCRLDDAAIEVLAAVPEAPSLRSLTLGYNSIGPVGARALANWPVLGNLWHLDLHDNFIGDAGLIALAESPYAGRLLELDLEQDCWNTRTFDFSDTAARALADSTTHGRLEAAFSGWVDEYHGCGYSPGFTREGLDLIRSSPLRDAPIHQHICLQRVDLQCAIVVADRLGEPPLCESRVPPRCGPRSATSLASASTSSRDPSRWIANWTTTTFAGACRSWLRARPMSHSRDGCSR